MWNLFIHHNYVLTDCKYSIRWEFSHDDNDVEMIKCKSQNWKTISMKNSLERGEI